MAYGTHQKLSQKPIHTMFRAKNGISNSTRRLKWPHVRALIGIDISGGALQLSTRASHTPLLLMDSCARAFVCNGVGGPK